MASHIHPTEEQQAVIDLFKSGQSFKVNALAGTGKTSTLIMLAEAQPYRKGLYLAYNKMLREEAEKKFPPNVHCKTIHGLAYHKVGHLYKGQIFQKTRPEVVIPLLGIGRIEIGFEDPEALHKRQKPPVIRHYITSSAVYSLVKQTVKNFCYSDGEFLSRQHVPSLRKTFLSMFSEQLSFHKNDDPQVIQAKEDAIKSMANIVAPQIYDKACDFWDKMRDLDNQEIFADHDTYLKLWQLQNPVLDEYDYILIDEAQDINGCMRSIVDNQTCQVVYVGDQYQQIYAFRGSVNAMQALDKPTLFLTQSFRFGEEIADEANKVLTLLQAERAVKGLDTLLSLVNGGNTQFPYTYIARTNGSLLDKYIMLMDAGLSCYVRGTLKNALKIIEDVYALYCGQTKDILSPEIRRIKSFDDLLLVVDSLDDPEITVATSFVKKHGNATGEVIQKILSRRNPPENKADVILTTAHSSKGLEYENVILSDDFRMDRDDEKHLLYVAMTRAKSCLSHSLQF